MSTGSAGEQQFALLFAQVEQRANEIVERALQEKKHFDEAEQPVSTMLAEQITTLVESTIIVMTTRPERRAEWRETIAQALENAQQRGTNWQIGVEFFRAILAILDGQPSSLAAGHPYAPALAAIQDGIARNNPEPDNEDNVPENR